MSGRTANIYEIYSPGKSLPSSGGIRAKWEQSNRSIIFLSQTKEKNGDKDREVWQGKHHPLGLEKTKIKSVFLIWCIRAIHAIGIASTRDDAFNPNMPDIAGAIKRCIQINRSCERYVIQDD